MLFRQTGKALMHDIDLITFHQVYTCTQAQPSEVEWDNVLN